MPKFRVPPDWQKISYTLVSQIVEHTEIDEHLKEIAENLNSSRTPVLQYI